MVSGGSKKRSSSRREKSDSKKRSSRREKSDRTREKSYSKKRSSRVERSREMSQGELDSRPVPKHLFSLELENFKTPDPFDVEVAPHRQMWRKELYSSYLEQIAANQKRLSRRNTNQDDDEDLKQHYYDNIDIEVFKGLDEEERIKSRDFQADFFRYTRDEKTTDGFDVGFYPYIYAAGICSAGYLTCYYKPPQRTLPKPNLITLLHLCQLAISIYNMHQVNATGHATCYHDIQVLKAMKFGTYGTNLNITFQTSIPYCATFQTRVYALIYPPQVPFSWFEIVLVKKLKGGEYDPPRDLSSQETETDYEGAEWLPKFPSSMEKLSDFNEKDPQEYGVRYMVCKDLSSSTFPLIFYLSTFALHQYNTVLHRTYRDQYKDNELNGDAKVHRVIDALKTLNEEHGITYYILFMASLDSSGDSQMFETKLFMSPIIPTTKIKIKFVRIVSYYRFAPQTTGVGL